MEEVTDKEETDNIEIQEEGNDNSVSSSGDSVANKTDSLSKSDISEDGEAQHTHKTLEELADEPIDEKEITSVHYDNQLARESDKSEIEFETILAPPIPTPESLHSEIDVNEDVEPDEIIETNVIPEEETDILENEIDDNEVQFVVTVKFRTDNNETMTSAFKINTKMIKVKERLAAIFKMDADDILLYYEGEECDDILPLSGLGVEPLGTIELNIKSNKPDNVFTPTLFQNYIPVVDVITVRVPKDEGGFKDIIVEIENQGLTKQWLGGYRHSITKNEYHHAAQQTLPRRRDNCLPPLYSKETQTPVFPLKDTASDTVFSRATQMWRNDHYIPNVDDKIVLTDPDRFIIIKPTILSLYKVVKILYNLKRFVMNFRYKKRKELEEQFILNTQTDKRTSYKELSYDKQGLLLSRLYPLTRNDFYTLYLLVGKWWKNEYDEIKKIKMDESRKAAFCTLLEKEISLLAAIDKQRTLAKKEMLKKQEIKFIEATARPIIFRNNKGVMSSIDTLETQQARELQEILMSYLNTKVTVTQRLDILNTLKHLIKSYDFYEATKELISLIERECDLLVMGVKSKYLKTLRDRIEQLLLKGFRTNTMNPSVKNYRKPDLPIADNKTYRCSKCKQLKPASDYNVHVVMRSFDVCYSCEWIANIGYERLDLGPYIKLLSYVRENEVELCCTSPVSFILQPVGMCYLTQKIWGSRSVLSNANYINDLRMVRWENSEDWTPWNCILLTFEESLIHQSIKNLTEFYDKSFIFQIKLKHMRARNHFVPLILSDLRMRDTGVWFNIQDAGEFLDPSHVIKFAQLEDFEYIT